MGSTLLRDIFIIRLAFLITQLDLFPLQNSQPSQCQRKERLRGASRGLAPANLHETVLYPPAQPSSQ